ncbi:ferritin-like domain-containing protein [Halanaerobaculum tunisiense]
MNNFTRRATVEINRELARMGKEWNQQLAGDDINHLLKQLYLAIESALRDAAYYRALAAIAPDRLAENLFEEFAKDERGHAYQFRQAYERLTGETYTAEQNYDIDIPEDEYESAIAKSIWEDTAQYKDYKSYYLMTNNHYLRDIFFNALHDKMYHAVRELYLLQMMDMGLSMMEL